MKRILKIVGILLTVAVVGLVLFLWIKHEPLPEGKSGAEADALAQKMLKALNFEAFENTAVLEWSFQGGRNQYVWNKQLGQVKMQWDDFMVTLNLNNPDRSKAFENGAALSGAEKEHIIETAQDNFNNDSFWLVAPYKVFDEGTKRSIVTLEDGSEALLVTYTKGGTTPGDSYLWLLNENGFPNAYKMWVQIIPVGGIEASWDDWLVTESNAFLPKSHQLGPITLSMGEVRGY